MENTKPTCSGWGAECSFAQEDEQCYGEIDVYEDYTADDWWWIHYCEGHKGAEKGEPYMPKEEE